MSTKILVTGATGNIGVPLVTQLIQMGSSIQVEAASRKGETVALAPGRSLDLLDAASAHAAFQGIERLFLLAPAHPEMETMTANAVEAAQAVGVKHLVRVSGASADANSEIAIARLQGRCDRLVVDSGIPYTLLQPKNFMQNFTTFLRDMVSSGMVYSSQGEGRVPFIDARDIAAVAARVLTAPEAHVGRAYTLTGPDALTNIEAVAMIAREIGRPVRVTPITEEQSVAAMRQAGMPEVLVEAMSSLNRVIAAGWVAEVTQDVPNLLGRPAARFIDFVREYRQAWL